MSTFLNSIRIAEHKLPIRKQLLFTIGILLLGIGLGAFSKYLDYHPQGLPYLLELADNRFDIHNFLGGFAPWILIAVCISVRSSSPFRAAVNVFVFFAGMVASYYLYTKYIAGFFPRSYVIIWCIFTVLSPLPAMISWYAKGRGIPAVIISAGILAVLFNTAFAYGWGYFGVRSILQLIVFFAGICILRRPPKESAAMMGICIVLAIIIEKWMGIDIW